MIKSMNNLDEFWQILIGVVVVAILLIVGMTISEVMEPRYDCSETEDAVFLKIKDCKKDGYSTSYCETLVKSIYCKKID